MNPHRQAQGERGQAIVLLVLGMVALLGVAGLAIDGGNLYTQQRRAQNAADNAALAYALALNQDTNDELTRANNVLASNGYVNGQSGVSVSIISPPPGYDNSYVEVVLTGTVPTAFVHFVFNGPAKYTVRAIARGQAGQSPMSGFALVTMNNCLTSGGNNVAVTGGGNSGGVNAHNGNMFVNVPENAGNHCAISPPNNGLGITVDAGFNIVSVGSYNYAGTANMTQPIQTGYNGGTPIGDPLAGLPEPTCTTNGTIVGGVYQPGNWNGGSMGSGTYAPGIYCITGSITLSGQNSITANGALFYFINGGATFTGQAGWTITAPTVNNCLGTYGQSSASCTYVGIAVFSARNNTSTIEVRGNGGSAITGTFYALSGTMQARGGGSTPDDTAVMGQVIAARALGNGNGTLDITYNDSVIYHLPPSLQLVK